MKTTTSKQFLYWMSPDELIGLKGVLKEAGFTLSTALLTPCQVLHASGKNVVYADPAVWSRMCVRQGSWYRGSARKGMTMMVSAERLPEPFAPFLDATMAQSDFQPEKLPDSAELQKVVESAEYTSAKPEAWEKKTWLDAFLFKVMFSVFRFWGWGDNLKKHWLGHRANHANFIAKNHAVELDGEKVAYSVTGNAGVCSSCVEFFNVIEPGSRKLVRSCPGAVIFGGAQRNLFYDLRPERGDSKRAS
jgi:hypothetical protein